jgi:hypothetical protein
LNSQSSEEEDFNGFIDAQNFGNLMRFSNHQGSARQINILSSHLFHHHNHASSVIVFRAKSEIKPGLELFLNYGSNFFASKVQGLATTVMKSIPEEGSSAQDDEQDYIIVPMTPNKGRKCTKKVIHEEPQLPIPPEEESADKSMRTETETETETEPEDVYEAAPKPRKSST